jgi:alpha-D-ribose 1-methylphosphonate 5-triphosphate synthase subunit PhnG
MTEPLQSPETAARRDWLAVLARATTTQLEAHAERAKPLPAMETVRAPEAGMVMLRGRIGGTGDSFNLGEASVTRCAVRLAGGLLGVGYTLGRDRRKAELVALFDALLQDDARGPWCMEQVIEPLRKRQAQQRDAASRAAATSRVDFFTMVRGEA